MTETSTYFTQCAPIIYRGDFDSHSTISDIADRIMSDMKFDERCRRSVEMKRNPVIDNSTK